MSTRSERGANADAGRLASRTNVRGWKMWLLESLADYRFAA
jgi:hypothetical protein